VSAGERHTRRNIGLLTAVAVEGRLESVCVETKEREGEETYLDSCDLSRQRRIVRSSLFDLRGREGRQHAYSRNEKERRDEPRAAAGGGRSCLQQRRER
jgi:hypothetical protein